MCIHVCIHIHIYTDIFMYIYEIGPSNASQGQHRRKDATEQIKNLTLAGSRTQVPGFSSATGTRGIAVTASALEKPGTWVRLPASVRFFICSVASFLLCCPCEALEGPIS